ncbi:ABC transporter permease subunit [Rossellomorea vietnamensis]|uniref:ABC transporter permease subunit n=2 Tax=Bacillaceae TaxID=186817 RepID=A0A5D4MIL2_9BACI|nr:ABC transporter permease subunit [Rossellomorea vietnamensis]
MKKIVHSLHIFIIIMMIIIILIPFIPLVLTSMSSQWRWPQIVPEVIQGRAWLYLFSEHSGTFDALWTSIIIALIVTFINLLLAIPAGDALGRMNTRGKWFIEAVMYAPIVIPSFVAVMGIHSILLRVGLTGTMTGVVLAHIPPTLPYMLRAMTISYQTIGYQWEELARMLGAGRFQRFWFVVLPRLIPGIIAGASLSILISLSQYLITFLIGSGQVITLPIIMFPFITGGDPSIASAYTVVFTLAAIGTLLLMDFLLRTYFKHTNKTMGIKGRL